MSSGDIRILQGKILEVMCYIDKLCRENDIEYFLMGGSALGAVRHKGFIPWDDDCDIFMTPDSYARFADVFEKNGDKENFYLQEMCKRDNMISTAKLRMNGTSYIEEAYEDLDVHQGIFVDIFMLHNCPRNKLFRLRQCLNAKYIVMRKIGASLKYTNVSGVKKAVAQVLNLLPKNFMVKHALKQIYKYNDKQTDYCCHFLGHAFMNAGIYKKDYFLSHKYVDFENTQLSVPEKVEEYLGARWGDYMKLPPEEKRKVAFHAKHWSADTDFRDYCKNIKDFSDEKYLY